MAPKISAEMREAIKLMRDGATAYRAAKIVGIFPQAISNVRNKKWFIELMKKSEVK